MLRRADHPEIRVLGQGAWLWQELGVPGHGGNPSQVEGKVPR